MNTNLWKMDSGLAAVRRPGMTIEAQSPIMGAEIRMTRRNPGGPSFKSRTCGYSVWQTLTVFSAFSASTRLW
jgi:hypothetical protein